MNTLTLFRDADGQWRWHVQSPNGRVVATSGEGYHNQKDALEQAARMFTDTVKYVTEQEP